MLKNVLPFFLRPFFNGKYCFLVFFTCLAVFPFSARSNQPIVKTLEDQRFIQKIYTTADGLPQNTATAILQANNGYLWIATFGGLSRFDGLEFKNYTPSNTPELIDNRLTSLYEDPAGVLWIGSENGNLFNYKDGKFSHILKSQSNPGDLSIRKIITDKAGVLWLLKLNEILNYDPKSGETNRTDAQQLKLDGMPQPSYFNDGTLDNNGNFLVATNAGLVKFDAFSKLPTLYHPKLNYDIGNIKFDSSETLWICDLRSVSRLVGDEIKTVQILHSDKTNCRFAANNSSKMPIAINKELLIFDNDGNLLDKKSDTLGMPTNLMSDLDGNIWLGNAAGLAKLSKRTVFPYTLFIDNVEHAANSVLQTRSGSVWTGIGPTLLEFTNNEFVSHDVSKYLFRPKDERVKSLAESPTGDLWFSSECCVYRFNGGDIKEFKPEERSIPEIGVIKFAKNGDMLLGSKNKGLYVFAGDKLTIKTIDDGLVNNHIANIYESDNGHLYIGTRGGLSVLKDGVFTNYTDQNGLKNNYIRDIVSFDNKTFWLGTYGGGISRFRDGEIRSVSSEDGLPEEVASSLLADDRGNFWVLGNKSIYSVDINELNELLDGKISEISKTRILDESHGMLIGEGNGGNSPAGWMASDKRLWFPMIRGGVVIENSINTQKSIPTYIEEIKVNGKIIDRLADMVLDSDNADLQIKYTGITFHFPEQVKFKYMLEGVDHNWHQAGTRRIAYYHYLPPGEYTFKVMALSGTAEPIIDSLNIKVYVPFWRSWAGLAIIATLVIGIIVLLLQYRYSLSEKKRKQEHEFSARLINAHEQERQRIAIDLHDSLGNNLLVIKNWAALAIRSIDDKKETINKLEEISNSASLAIDETRVISQDLRPMHLYRLGLTSTLKNIVEKASESSGLDLDCDIDDIDMCFQPDAELKIFRIVQESLNNIIKHSNATKVTVRIKRSETNVKVLIKDNGKGFNTKNAYSKSIDNFGLEGIKHRAESLNGDFKLESIVGEGTTLYLVLKINNEY